MNGKEENASKNREVTSKEKRRWPQSGPSKKGSLKGHCANND